jgi:hypothetical protein
LCVRTAIVLPACYCPAENGWLVTSCDSSDAVQCIVGSTTRYCDVLGNWDTPDSSNCIASGLLPFKSSHSH